MNRYSTLPKINIKNTQVLPDLGVYDDALERQQKNYDTTAAEGAKFVSDVSKLQGYGDYAKQYISTIDSDVKNKLGTLSGQDLGSPEVRNQLHGLIQSVASDPKIQEINQVNALRANYEKQQQDLDSKGKLHNNQKYLQDRAWDIYSKTGQISPELAQPLYEAQDLVKGRGDLVSMLKANGTDVIQSLSDGTAYKNSSKGVASDRIKKAVIAQLPTYMNSQYGRQELTDYKAAVAQGQINPKTTSFEDYLTKQVLSTASNYAFSDFSTNKDSALRDKQDRDLKAKKEEEDKYAGEGFTPAMNASKEVEIDSDNRINQNPFLDAWDAVTGGDSRTPEQLATEKNLKASKEKAGFKGSLQDYAKELAKDPNVKVRYYSADEAKKQSKQFFDPENGGGISMNTVVFTNEYPQGISVLDFAKEKDIDLEKAKKGFAVVGEVAPDNPYTPKGKQVIIGNESVIMDDRFSRLSPEANFKFEASKAKYNGEGVHTFQMVDPEDGHTYEITSRADGQGNLLQPEYKLIK